MKSTPNLSFDQVEKWHSFLCFDNFDICLHFLNHSLEPHKKLDSPRFRFQSPQFFHQVAYCYLPIFQHSREMCRKWIGAEGNYADGLLEIDPTQTITSCTDLPFAELQIGCPLWLIGYEFYIYE